MLTHFKVLFFIFIVTLSAHRISAGTVVESIGALFCQSTFALYLGTCAALYGMNAVEPGYQKNKEQNRIADGIAGMNRGWSLGAEFAKWAMMSPPSLSPQKPVLAPMQDKHSQPLLFVILPQPANEIYSPAQD